MKALVADAVYHSYGRGAARTDVLRGFSLEMEEGEFVALMGPSGSGKSTFLHLAAGLIVPDAGSIRVGGETVTAMGDAQATVFRRRREGVVFQAFNLVDALTVEENITLPALLDGARPDPSRVEELVAALGLGGRERRRPSQLSGGECQRVALARALYMKPEIVLADEPTGNLDVSSARSICGLLGALNKSEGCAMLLVTHDPLVAASASRVCFMKDGAIAASFPTRNDAAEISRLYLETCR